VARLQLPSAEGNGSDDRDDRHADRGDDRDDDRLDPASVEKPVHSDPEVDRIYDTPQKIEDQLRELANEALPNLAALTQEVQNRSFFTPANPKAGCRGFPLFHVGHTGVDRQYQEYVCREPHCPAYVKYEFAKPQAKLSAACFRHSHDVEMTSHKGANSLRPIERQQIRDMTAEQCTSEHVQRKLGLALDAEVLYDARRPVLVKLTRNQAQKLIEQIKQWDEWEVTVRREDTTFAGCYGFRITFKNTELVRQTLVMDDTACTNYFEFPLVLIVASDEHNKTQLVAWAFIMDRTKFSFADFLRWLKPMIDPNAASPAPDSEPASEPSAEPASEPSAEPAPDAGPPVPLAFAVDRHLGQLAALREVYPRSCIVYCRFHLKMNLKATFGRRSSIVIEFGRLMDCIIDEAKWLADLDAAARKYRKGSPQWNSVRDLREELDHYSPIRIARYTRFQATTIVEGANSGLKRSLGHQICTLEDVAVALRIIADRFLGNHWKAASQPSAPLAEFIMPIDDQKQFGQYPLTVIYDEYKQIVG
jgi:hypothetical protein